MRGADVLASAMAEAGVRRLFSLSGNQIMPVYDACIDAGIEIVHTRHEAAAVHMADAFARISGDVGVALLTAGPGHANGIAALYSARMSEAPVVSLSGHAPLARLGQGAFQEMAQAEMAAVVCKAAWTAPDAAGLGALFGEAAVTARRGRPGPVHVSLPFDLVQATVDRPPPRRAPVAEAPPAGDEIQGLARWLGKAKRPLLLAGPAFAHGTHRALLERLDGAGGVPALVLESPRGINDPALGAFAEVLAEADRIALLGRGPDFVLRFAEKPFVHEDCRFALVDSEPRALKRARAVLGKRLKRVLQADPGLTAFVLAQVDRAPARDPGWSEAVRAAVNHRPATWAGIASDPGRGLHPVAVCRAVQAFIDHRPDTVLVADGGEFGQWAQACVRARRRLINGPSGAIGAALPFAAGARLADPGAMVVAMLGDGTMGFHLAEFDTALRAGAPYVAVVGNDARWNAEHQIQLRDYGPGRLVGCELLPTRYDRVVAALGGHGEHVEHDEELAPALERAAASGLPACVNVKLDGLPAPVIRRA